MQFKVTPDYLKAVVGDQVNFNCHSDNSSPTWELHGGTMGLNMMSVQVSKDSYKLVIDDVQLKNAGIYLCVTKSNYTFIIGEGKLEVGMICYDKWQQSLCCSAH